MINNILYISTNEVWSGSEELWFASALLFESQGLKVSYATKYAHNNLKKIKGPSLHYGNQGVSLPNRIINRLFPIIQIQSPLNKFIKEIKPGLIVISQGNNVSSLDLMVFCLTKGIRYITITQLVTAAHFLQIDQNNLLTYQSAYCNAHKNFFVSKNNLELNNLMFGTTFKNAFVTNNPCRFYNDQLINYPPIKKTYNVGLVGRIECFHKGYDLLIQVLNQKKWRERNIEFNIYGDGPHLEILKSNIDEYKLTNLALKGFVNDVRSVWKANHILFMPSRMEGQALSLIEAMYYERAAIVTDVGGATELIADEINGFVATSATVHDLDIALEKAWSNRENWEQMGKLSHKVVADVYKMAAEESLNSEIIKGLD